MTNEFTDRLFSRLYDDERIIKFKKANVSDDGHIRIEFLVSHDNYVKLTDDYRKKVLSISEEILPKNLAVAVDYIIAVHDEKTLVRLIYEYIRTERPNFYSLFAAVPIDVVFNNDLLTVTFTMEKFMHDYAVESSLEKELLAFLDTIVLEEIEITYVELPNSEGKQIKQTEYFAETIRTIPTEIIKCYTRNEFGPVRYIYDIKDKELASVTVCGKISGIRARYIEKIDKTVYSFTINDTTSTMKVKYFARKNKNFDWEEVFVDDATLMIMGAVQMDKFENGLVLSAIRIATCNADYSGIDLKSNFNKEYSDYRYIFPEQCHNIEQDNFLEDKDVPERLLKNEYCVFDIETTGLNFSTDEIIEIGAVKIVNGVFTESFSTFVRPNSPVPENIEKLTGIKNEDVALAPQLCDVIPDFYKFTRGTILVGHNIIGFDLIMLNANAQRVKYEFNNDAVDTYLMARNLLGGSKNKLIDVCNKLGVPLIGAHRAVNDAEATAKCFLKLIKMEK